MFLRYKYTQVGYESDWNLITIPEPFLDQGFLSFKAIEAMLIQDGVQMESPFSFRYYDGENQGYILATEDIQLSCDKDIRIQLHQQKNAENVDSWSIQKYLEEFKYSVSQQIGKIVGNQTQPQLPYRRSGSFELPAGQQMLPRLQTFEKQRPSLWNNLLVPKLDIVIFHSAPLVEIDGSVTKPLQDTTLDFEAERCQILETLQRNKIGCQIRFDAATTEKLVEVLNLQPKIIHISCHGYYDSKSANKFYLQFENQTNVGVLDPLSCDRLKSLLQSGNSHNCVVFVSAWFSGAIGQVFLDAGFPWVICVNNQCKILDDAAVLFARTFYRDLMAGQWIQNAFDSSKSIVRDQQSQMLQGCCCSHTHKVDCLWYAEHKKKSTDDMHEEHMPKWSYCPNARNGVHKLDWEWATAFMDKYAPGREITDEEYDADCRKVCCCSPDLPHGEGLKFEMLVREEKFKQKKLFEEANINEGIENVAPLPEQFRPPYVNTPVIGRNLEMQQIAKILSSSNANSRLLYVVGETGIGKSVLVKKAAMYTFERRVFPSGVFYIDLKHRTDIEGIYSRIATEIGISYRLTNKELFFHIDKLQIWVIIDNANDLIQQKQQKFEQRLHDILTHTTSPKFIIITDNPPTDSAVESISLQPLEPDAALKVVKTLIPKEKGQEITDLGYEQEILEAVGRNPGQIEHVIPLLREKDISDFMKDIEKAKVRNPRMFTIRTSLAFLEKEDPNAQNLFHLILWFPIGLFDSDLDILCKKKGYDWKTLVEVLIGQVQEDKSSQWLVRTKPSGSKIPDRLYIGDEMFRKYLLKNNQNHEIVQREAIIYLASLSRAILRALVENVNEGCEIDWNHINFTAALRQGIWGEYSEYLSRKIYEKIGKSYPLERFKTLETNFLYYVNQMKNEHRPLDVTTSQSLGELILCVTSIYIIQGRFDQAIKFGKSGISCVKALGEKFYRALIRTTLASVYLIQNQVDNAKIYCLKAGRTFRSLGQNEGRGECYLLQAQITIMDPRIVTSNIVMQNQEGLMPGLPDLKMLRESSNYYTSKTEKDVAMNVDDCYELAQKKFSKVDAQFGIGRQLLLKSESTMNNTKKLIAYNHDVRLSLTQSLQIFRQCKQKHWELRCLAHLTEFFVSMNFWQEAKKYCLLAKAMAAELKNRNIETSMKTKHNRINGELKKHTSNNLTFLNAYPLCLKNEIGQLEKLGPICRQYNSNYQQEIEASLSNWNKIINVRMDILTRDSLKNFTRGSRILILSSDITDLDRLVVEGAQSQADPMSFTDIQKELGTDLDAQGVEVVLFAQPQSVNMAEFFHKQLGVPHAIGFDFPNLMESDETVHVQLLVRKVIINFCLSFYNQVVEMNTVKHAVSVATYEIHSEMQKIYKMYSSDCIDKSFLKKQVPVLIDSENSNHNCRIFSSEDISIFSNITRFIFRQKVLNLSQEVSNSNMEDLDTFLAGRQFHIFQTLEGLTESGCVQIIGDAGFGKTQFLSVIGHFVHIRHKYKDGVYLFDLKGLQNMEDLNEKVQQAKIFPKDSEKLSILIILDNWDQLIKENLQSFSMNLKYYIDTWGYHILLSSRSPMTNGSIFAAQVKLGPLLDIEAATMITVNTKPLTREEIWDQPNDTSIVHLLASSVGIKECKGNPRRLKMFARDLREESFKTVQSRIRMVNKVMNYGFSQIFKTTTPQFTGLSSLQSLAQGYATTLKRRQTVGDVRNTVRKFSDVIKGFTATMLRNKLSDVQEKEINTSSDSSSNSSYSTPSSSQQSTPQYQLLPKLPSDPTGKSPENLGGYQVKITSIDDIEENKYTSSVLQESSEQTVDNVVQPPAPNIFSVISGFQAAIQHPHNEDREYMASPPASPQEAPEPIVESSHTIQTSSAFPDIPTMLQPSHTETSESYSSSETYSEPSEPVFDQAVTNLPVISEIHEQVIEIPLPEEKKYSSQTPQESTEIPISIVTKSPPKKKSPYLASIYTKMYKPENKKHLKISATSRRLQNIPRSGVDKQPQNQISSSLAALQTTRQRITVTEKLPGPSLKRKTLSKPRSPRKKSLTKRSALKRSKVSPSFTTHLPVSDLYSSMQKLPALPVLSHVSSSENLRTSIPVLSGVSSAETSRLGSTSRKMRNSSKHLSHTLSRQGLKLKTAMSQTLKKRQLPKLNTVRSTDYIEISKALEERKLHKK